MAAPRSVLRARIHSVLPSITKSHRFAWALLYETPSGCCIWPTLASTSIKGRAQEPVDRSPLIRRRSASAIGCFVGGDRELKALRRSFEAAGPDLTAGLASDPDIHDRRDAGLDHPVDLDSDRHSSKA